VDPSRKRWLVLVRLNVPKGWTALKSTDKPDDMDHDLELVHASVDSKSPTRVWGGSGPASRKQPIWPYPARVTGARGGPSRAQSRSC
jgi:hypothetical protein